MQNQNPSANAQYQTIIIVWASLLMSQFFLLIILFVIKGEMFGFDSSKPLLGENAIIVILFAVLGISTFLASFVLKKKFLDQAVATQNVGMVQSAVVVACALCEATSLFGFLLAVAFDYQYFFLWFKLGFIGIILNFPRRDDVIAASYKK